MPKTSSAPKKSAPKASGLPGQYQATRLANGALIATDSLADVRSGSLGVYLDIGSRDEADHTNGLAHLFEHMVFKGTPKYSSLQIVQRFEASGGQVNAYTSKEQTCLHAKVVDTEVNASLSMLMSMALDSHFDPAELKKEKEVIVEEIHSVHDNPEEHVYELFSTAVFGDHPVGRPIAGTDKSVRGMQRKDLLAHQELTRNRAPMLITAAGKVDHDSIVDLACKAFKVKGQTAAKVDPTTIGLMRTDASLSQEAPPKKQSLKTGVTATIRPRLERGVPAMVARHLSDKRKVQQCNVLLGGPAFGWDDDRRLALILLNLVLGDGMSSRLFQSVREERGLVYSIYSNPEFLIGCGVFSIGFATEAGDLPKALTAICGEIKRLKREGLPTKELNDAKRNLRGSVLLGLESTNARMGSLARQVFYGTGIEGVDRFLQRAEKVTTAQVRACIDIVFDSKKWSSAIVGPEEVKLNIASALRF
jgi:predicted Zn-dependent peptidase